MESLALERNKTVLFFAAGKTENRGASMDGWIKGEKMRTFSVACFDFPGEMKSSAKSEERRECRGVMRKGKVQNINLRVSVGW